MHCSRGNKTARLALLAQREHIKSPIVTVCCNVRPHAEGRKRLASHTLQLERSQSAGCHSTRLCLLAAAPQTPAPTIIQDFFHLLLLEEDLLHVDLFQTSMRPDPFRWSLLSQNNVEDINYFKSPMHCPSHGSCLTARQRAARSPREMGAYSTSTMNPLNSSCGRRVILATRTVKSPALYAQPSNASVALTCTSPNCAGFIAYMGCLVASVQISYSVVHHIGIKGMDLRNPRLGHEDGYCQAVITGLHVKDQERPRTIINASVTILCKPHVALHYTQSTMAVPCRASLCSRHQSEPCRLPSPSFPENTTHVEH